MQNQTQTATRETSRPSRKATITAQIVSINDYEVVASFGSESNPTRKPYETILNRYSARPTCDCRGYSAHKHCCHCDALVGIALEENLIIKIRKGRHAEAKAVIDDYDHFADLDLVDLTPTEIAYADRIASESETIAYQSECQARYFAGGCC